MRNDDEWYADQLWDASKKIDGDITVRNYESFRRSSDDDWPSYWQIKNHFGSWHDALYEAGLGLRIGTPGKEGNDGGREKKASNAQIVACLNNGMSVEDTSEALGYDSRIRISDRDIELRKTSEPVNQHGSHAFTVPASIISDLGYDPNETVYYSVETWGDKIQIRLHDNRAAIVDSDD